MSPSTCTPFYPTDNFGPTEQAKFLTELYLLEPILSAPTLSKNIHFEEIEKTIKNLIESHNLLVDLNGSKPSKALCTNIEYIKNKIFRIHLFCEQLGSLCICQNILQKKIDITPIPKNQFLSRAQNNNQNINHILDSQKQEIINNLMLQLKEAQQNFTNIINAKKWSQLKLIGGIILALILAYGGYRLYKYAYLRSDEKRAISEHNKRGQQLISETTDIQKKLEAVQKTHTLLIENMEKMGPAIIGTQERLQAARAQFENTQHIKTRILDHERRLRETEEGINVTQRAFAQILGDLEKNSRILKRINDTLETEVESRIE